jgi:hypothetical protein
MWSRPKELIFDEKKVAKEESGQKKDECKREMDCCSLYYVLNEINIFTSKCINCFS